MRQLKKLTRLRQLKTPGQAPERTSINYRSKPPQAPRRDKRIDQRIHVVRRLKDFPPPTPQLTPCILWQGSVDKYGYGTFKRYLDDGTRLTYKVHRWAFEQAYGIRRLRPDQVIMHACDNPPCFRIDHLSVGTLADNNADKIAKGRAVNPPKTIRRGAEHATWTWTPERQAVFDEMRAAGATADQIATVTGVDRATVYRHIKRTKEANNAPGARSATERG